jgi:hypothetical protein
MTVTEIILLIIASTSLGTSGVVLFKLRKIFDAKSDQRLGILPSRLKEDVPLAKTVEAQSMKITELEKQVSLYKRPTTGINLKWAAPREDKSAYLLGLLNDFPEQIYNVTVSIEPIYQKCTSIYSQSQKCDPQKSIDIFFLPAIWADNNSEPTVPRDEFIKLWLDNKLKPIEIIVQYTRTPTINDNYETAKIFFTRDNLTKHLKTSIQTAKTRLTVVQPLKK